MNGSGRLDKLFWIGSLDGRRTPPDRPQQRLPVWSRRASWPRLSISYCRAFHHVRRAHRLPLYCGLRKAWGLAVLFAQRISADYPAFRRDAPLGLRLQSTSADISTLCFGARAALVPVYIDNKRSRLL